MGLHPAPYWALVQPSDVDPSEQERPSGLIVQHHHDDRCEQHRVKRGVVLEVGTGIEQSDMPQFKAGDVILYIEHVTVGEQALVFISHNNFLGWEEG